ncbi:MAG: energy transducer TonB [Sphingomonadales bacterium]|nr:energy transducer TonB [Sphingomonadales bacterium]
MSPRPVPTPPAPAEAPVATTSAGSGDSIGAGAGSGAGGNGPGGGGDPARHAVWIGDDLTDRYYPEAAKRARLQGVVEVRYTVRVDGWVRGCQVDHVSGDAELGRLTCALVEQRRLYDPALNALGEPVEELAGRRFRFVLRPHRS